MGDISGQDNLVVIAYGVPGEKDGYEIALYTSLAVYCEVFPVIHYITLGTDMRTPKLPPNARSVHFHHIEVPQRSILNRFLRSLGGKKPACVLRFATDGVSRKMRSIITSINGNYCPPTHVIYEDIPVASMASCLRDLLPGIKSAIRSHNVLQNSYRGMEGTGNMVSKAAWLWELVRIRCFEDRLIHSFPTVWSITMEDLCEYRKLYGCTVAGVMGVGIETNAYDGAASGHDFNVLHIGGLDAKRGLSMRNFIKGEWVKVRSRVPEARLLLAGKNSEHFTDESIGVAGCGEVQSAVEFLKNGRVFINTQEIGSGVKLKSLVAMAAGKALISTENGVQGIHGTSGTHFLVTHGIHGMAENIIRLLLKKDVTDRIAKEAQAFVNRHFEIGSVIRRSVPLVKKWKSSMCQRDMDGGRQASYCP